MSAATEHRGRRTRRRPTGAQAADRVRHALGRRGDGAKGVVLLYHRVAEPGADPLALSVSPECFRDHLDVLAREFTVVPLADLHRAVSARASASRFAAITFDDGYADNATVAAPELERRGLPATVFVASTFVADGRPFWWDEIQALVLHARSPDDRLVVEVAGRRHEWPTAGAAQRREAVQQLVALLRAAPRPAVAAVLDQVRDRASRSAPGGEPPAVLRPADVADLAHGGLISIGAHTRSHCALVAQDAGIAAEEIVASRRDIAEWTGRPPEDFSYPFGLWSRRSRRQVREAGFARAVAIRSPGAVTAWSDPFAIPRVLVGAESGTALAERLARLVRGAPAAASRRGPDPAARLG